MEDLTRIPPDARVDSTLSKGLLLLELLARRGGAMGVSELSRDLGLSKSNAFRLLQTLRVMGYVRHRPDKRYEATLKSWRIGRRVVEGLNLRSFAAPAMQMLSRETGEAVTLAVAEGLTMTCLDKIESRQPIRSWIPVGAAAPIHAVATGKAILATDWPTYRGLLDGQLSRHTERTLTTPEALEADIARTITSGYAIDRGEFRSRVHGYAAAIRLPQGEALGAIGLSLPDLNLPPDADAHFGALVCRAAAEVTALVAEA
ncbi:IclR family transcriptional regulator [Pseudooceanicola sp. CBS1P-1]|uniref:Helix-turn-helix domain-containing protein n=1 Tax=Pseudooceanicola albus TaxID=2692189 RepID=A0A6L7G7H5_9RHOB|nr:MULTISPECIES: IclR family transcriptional regulator [Pseudooceanicola]MBT9385743.1 IclR family transcriptional regulator [Pseudooceanicola endophyticus]MXN19975.1 helix-turn-helix domain-containing protein [Pseudooceanicola albus]